MFRSVGSSAGNQTLYYVEVTDDMDTHLGNWFIEFVKFYYGETHHKN